jgi:hypothetical protein
MWVVVMSSSPSLRSSTGTFPRTSPQVGARDGDRIAAKAQFREVYGVLAEEVVAHPHVGETPPCERGLVWLVEWFASGLPLLRLHVRVETRHVHAERHLAKAGVANGKVFERSFLGGPRVAWGSQNPKGEWPCRARSGQSPLARSVFRMCVRQRARPIGRALREGPARRGGGRKTRSGWSREEPSSR